MLPLWAVALIAGGCIIFKMAIGVVLSKDIYYKTSHVVDEIAKKSYAESPTNFKKSFKSQMGQNAF